MAFFFQPHISLFFFRFISFILDCYQRSPVQRLALHLLFFPSLLSLTFASLLLLTFPSLVPPSSYISLPPPPYFLPFLIFFPLPFLPSLLLSLTFPSFFPSLLLFSLSSLLSLTFPSLLPLFFPFLFLFTFLLPFHQYPNLPFPSSAFFPLTSTSPIPLSFLFLLLIFLLPFHYLPNSSSLSYPTISLLVSSPVYHSLILPP